MDMATSEEDEDVSEAGGAEDKRPLFPANKTVHATGTQTWSLAALKLHFFLVGAGSASVVPFAAVLCKQKGLSESTIGLVLAAGAVALVAVRPAVAAYVDRHPSRKISVFRLLIFTSWLLFTCLYLSSPAEDTAARPMSVLAHTCSNANGSSVVRVPVHVTGSCDPCAVFKFNGRLADVAMTCGFACRGEDADYDVVNFEGEFVGADVQFVEHKLVVNVAVKSDVDVCSSGLRCRAECPDDYPLRLVLNASSSPPSSSSWAALWICLVWASAAVSYGALATLEDAFCQQVASAERAASYGGQRLWASLGYGLSALMVGSAVDSDSENSLIFEYRTAFAAMAVAYAVDLLIVGYIRIPTSLSASSSCLSPSRSWSSSALYSRLSNPSAVVFLVFCAAVGIARFSLPFQFLLLEELSHRADCNGAKALKFLQGLCIAINCMAEIPVFAVSGSVIRRLGVLRVMMVVLCSLSARFLFYGVMSSPWQTVLVEALHGAYVGLFLPVMNAFAHSLDVDGDTATTMTAVAYAAYEGVGVFVSPLIGALFQHWGGSVTFAVLGSVMATAAVTLFVAVTACAIPLNNLSQRKSRR